MVPEVGTPTPAPSLEDLQSRIRQFEQRVGTEEDVRTVKSQRDTTQAQLQQTQQQLQATQAQLQELQVLKQQLSDQQASAYAQTLPADQAKQYMAEYQLRRQSEAVQQEYARAQTVRSQAEQQAQFFAALQAAQQALDAEIALVRSVGLDPEKYDFSKGPSVRQVWQADLARQRSLQAAPPPKPPAAPVRGNPAPAQNLEQKFESMSWGEKVKFIEEIKNTRGRITVDDLLAR